MASMTKEELKTAIINHGLSPPPASAKKEEFVEMYNEHVAPIVEEAGEFSSDDEVTISPKKRGSKSARTSAKSPKTSQTGGSRDSTLEITDSPAAAEGGAEDVDVEALDDDQLFQLLKENGIDVGPIVDSTRPLYKKKLAFILNGGTGLMNGSTNGKEFSDTENEEENGEAEEDDQPALVITPKERTSTRSKASSSSQKSTRSSARVSQKSPLSTTSSSLAASESGLRKRLNITEETESSLIRSTPTPRRSIHSYKVTETTRQTIVQDKDGQTRDISRTVERVESTDAVDSKSSATTAASLKKLLLLLLVLAVVGGLVYYFVAGPGTASVQTIMDSVRKIEQAASPAAAPEAPAAAPPAAAEPPAAAAAKEPAAGAA